MNDRGTMKSLFKRCMIVMCLSVYTCGSVRVKRGFCSTRNLDIKNGNYRLRSGNSVADFTCNDGFTLYGMERAVCFGSKWSNDPPICISNNCQEIPQTSILKILEEFEGAVLKFSCAALYKLKGESTLICDGTDWSAPTPSCLAWVPPLSCDFENAEICGWSHHDKDDQDWRWNTGKTSTSRTGPSHDHTLGDGRDGHYMYFETSSPTRIDHTAILQSPLYPASYSRQRCFHFWYHILGVGDIGELEVFFKPESVTDLKTLKLMFHENSNRGDVWYEQSIRVPKQTEPFQILLVATRGTSYRSDFAVDDVSLVDCIDPPSTTTKTIATTNTIEVSRTRPPTTTSPKPTPKPVTTTTTTAKTTTSTTAKPTTITTPRPTTIRTTTAKASTTRTSTTRRKTSPRPSKIVTSKVTFSSNTQQANTGYTKNAQSKQTLEPKINPNLRSGEVKHIHGEDRAGSSRIVWVVLGVAIVVVIAGAAVGIFLYRRRKQKRCEKLDPLSSTNPLYTAINGDDGTVHFAADDLDDHEGY